MANKAGLPANEGAVTPEEPGAVDNRLSITPSDFPAVAEWEDGQEYDISELGEGVKLRQISPGEFEVMPGSEAENAGEAAAPGEEADAAAAAPAKRRGNPAVEDLAGEM